MLYCFNVVLMCGSHLCGCKGTKKKWNMQIFEKQKMNVYHIYIYYVYI